MHKFRQIPRALMFSVQVEVLVALSEGTYRFQGRIIAFLDCRYECFLAYFVSPFTVQLVEITGAQATNHRDFGRCEWGLEQTERGKEDVHANR